MTLLSLTQTHLASHTVPSVTLAARLLGHLVHCRDLVLNSTLTVDAMGDSPVYHGHTDVYVSSSALVKSATLMAPHIMRKIGNRSQVR